MATTTTVPRTGLPALDMWAGLVRWPGQAPFWTQADDLARTWAQWAWPWVAAFAQAPAERPLPAVAVPAPGKTMDELSVGDEARFTKVITQDDINAFARVSGDVNPVHVDEEFASGTLFKGRIAHGVLTAGLISAAIGLQLPGTGTIYISQSLRWLKPVRPGDELTAVVTIAELIPEKNRAMLDTVVLRGEEVVLDGKAMVMPPRT